MVILLLESNITFELKVTLPKSNIILLVMVTLLLESNITSYLKVALP